MCGVWLLPLGSFSAVSRRADAHDEELLSILALLFLLSFHLAFLFFVLVSFCFSFSLFFLVLGFSRHFLFFIAPDLSALPCARFLCSFSFLSLLSALLSAEHGLDPFSPPPLSRVFPRSDHTPHM